MPEAGWLDWFNLSQRRVPVLVHLVNGKQKRFREMQCLTEQNPRGLTFLDGHGQPTEIPVAEIKTISEAD